MSRINRRNWTTKDTKSLPSGGFFDLVDNSVKEGLRINDDEYNLLCVKASDEELDSIITHGKPSFADKRRIINMLNKYIDYDKDI